MHRIPTICAAALVALPACAQDGFEFGAKNAPYDPAFDNQTRAPLTDSVAVTRETVASGLNRPWGIEVLPDGSYLVTERPGDLRHVTRAGEVSPPISGVPEVVARDQGGLLDVALAEDFETSGVIFLTYAKPVDGGTATAAARAVLSDDRSSLSEVQDIFVQWPAANNAMHFGSRAVPHDGHVYVTTGEHFTVEYRQYAQDTGRTYGKVVRVTPEGDAPGDNPFADQGGAAAQVWTLGHRNVQGAAIRPDTGALWTLEHGPAGGDELNRIEAGANYGWPEVSYGINYGGSPVGTGEPRAEGFVEPRYYWDPVIAPGGFVFYHGEMFADWQGDVLAASLNPGGLVRLSLDGDTVTEEERFFTGDARIRDIDIDRDGAVLMLVDAPDGQILRVTPAE